MQLEKTCSAVRFRSPALISVEYALGNIRDDGRPSGLQIPSWATGYALFRTLLELSAAHLKQNAEGACEGGTTRSYLL